MINLTSFKTTINHKVLGIIVGVGIASYLSLSVNSYIQISNDMVDINSQIENYKFQNSNIVSSTNNKSAKLASDTNLSYYAGSIYAYAKLEDFQVETKNGETKYKDTIQLNLTFTEFKDKNKFKEFIKALSYLGYIENVTNKNLVLNVTKFTIEDAIKLNKLNNNKE